MAPTTSADEAVLHDTLLQKRIADLAKCGILWTPPSQRSNATKAEEPAQESPTQPMLTLDNPVRKGPKHPRRKASVPDLPSEPESESEMMGSAYNDAIAKVRKMRDSHLARNPGISQSEAAKLDDEAPVDLGLKIGEKAANHEHFVPWRFLLRYAELYVGKAHNPTVEPYFDEVNIFEHQPWDLFYLYEPETLADNTDPILFVRTVQLEAFLRKINRKHKLALTIPDGGNEVKFARQFPLSTPQPRYLDRTTAASSYPKMIRRCPLSDPEDDLSKATETDRDEFAHVLKRCKESWDGAHGKGRGSKARKKAITRYENRKAWGHAIKRVQRWLGLSKKASSVVSHAAFTGQEPSPSPSFGANSQAPYNFEDDVVFVCFDVEMDENNAQVVTEVGFGVLDTRDLKGVAPGQGAENWSKLIQARHLRIKEYLLVKNFKYVDGCPEKFQFGKSEIVGIDRIEKVCTGILSPKDSDGKPRRVVVVGHDIKQDIELLFGIDVDIYELPGLIDIIDNQRIQQHDAMFKDPQRLAVVLRALGIEHRYLHNGGNDAVYTLQSMLALAVCRRQKSLAKDPKLKAVHRPKPELGDPVLDMGWSTGGEDSDGGRPPRLVDPYKYLKDPITGKKGISNNPVINNDEN
ncbi:unnamed protein product [Discula destructiva]